MIYDFNFQRLNNKKVLVQLSGGKDSIACLALLTENHITCSAIHFIHDYAYSIPTDEAKKVCKDYNIELQIIDITKEIKELLLNNHIDRPCRKCKGIMDKKTVEFAIKNEFNYICTGDSGDDTSLIARLNQYNGSDLFVGSYFNKAVELPQFIKIIRPLITTSSKEVFDYLKKRGITVNRVCDTGDKYFEYSREGCPLQFKDFCVDYTENLLQKLKKYNSLCAEFAKSNGIQASIHFPSELIVTIPKGYELSCRNYLEKHGCLFTKEKKNCLNRNRMKEYFIQYSITNDFNDISILNKAFKRFLERLFITIEEENIIIQDSFIFKGHNIDINLKISKEKKLVFGLIFLPKSVSKDTIKEIILEIFHTDNITIKTITSLRKNIVLFDNEFSGCHGLMNVLHEEFSIACEELGYKVFIATSFKEAEYILKHKKIDFTIEFGEFTAKNSGKNFYDVFSIPHYQWIIDNPHKVEIDNKSAKIHYIFIDNEFNKQAGTLANRPLVLPLGYITNNVKPKNKNLFEGKKDGVLFLGQIKDLKEIETIIDKSSISSYVYDFINQFDIDYSFITQFNSFINKYKDNIHNTDLFFRLTNSYLRAKKRLLTIENIHYKDVYIAGKNENNILKNQKNVHYIGEISYRESTNFMKDYRYVLNVDPNYYSCYHDRVLRSINSDTVCITNENNLISTNTGFSASYKFSNIKAINDLLEYLDKNYDMILNEQKRFIKGLDWISSLKNIIMNIEDSSDEL